MCTVSNNFNRPNNFRVLFGFENIQFKERITVDLMYINGNNIIHIFDEKTKFSNAEFFPDISTRNVWKIILKFWCKIYTGLPNRIIVDKGSQFGKLFVDIYKLSNVQVDETGVESNYSLGLGRRYHQPLRQTYRIVLIYYPDNDPSLALSAAVKDINETLGSEGLV